MPSPEAVCPCSERVAISTLHGSIIHVWADTGKTVAEFKQKCLDACPWHISPLRINADLAQLMGCCVLDDLIGIRISTWLGDMLEDDKTLASQVVSLPYNHSDFYHGDPDAEWFFKLVFVKKYDLNSADKSLVNTFASQAYRRMNIGRIKNISMTQYGTDFSATPLWGIGTKSNDILGLVYEHSKTDYHCQLKHAGQDPCDAEFDDSDKLEW